MRLRSSRKLTVFGIAVMAMGLLLWARLILVTGRPRTAIADPQRKQAGTPAPAAPAAPPAEPEPAKPPAKSPVERDVMDSLLDDPRFAPPDVIFPDGG